MMLFQPCVFSGSARLIIIIKLIIIIIIIIIFWPSHVDKNAMTKLRLCVQTDMTLFQHCVYTGGASECNNDNVNDNID